MSVGLPLAAHPVATRRMRPMAAASRMRPLRLGLGLSAAVYSALAAHSLEVRSYTAAWMIGWEPGVRTRAPAPAPTGSRGHDAASPYEVRRL